MPKATWPSLRILVPPSLFGAVIERAKAENKAVSKWCREAIEQVLNARLQPKLTPVNPILVTDILSGGEMDVGTFALALTKALKQQPVEEDGAETAPREVWDLVKSLIERGVLKAEMREGVRFVSLLS